MTGAASSGTSSVTASGTASATASGIATASWPAAPPAELVEVQLGTVNPWQCDNNLHLNFQFYCHEFDHAARWLAICCGGDGDAPQPAIRHLRFHAELRAADGYRVASARIGDGPQAGALIHWLSDAASGRVAATALDLGGASFEGPTVAGDRVAAAFPRSLTADEPSLPLAALVDGGWSPTARNRVTADQCTPNGQLSERHFAAMLAGAASHAWARVGFGADWAREHALGRVAVEARLRHFAPAVVGDALVLHSRITAGASGKGVRLQHLLHRLSDAAVIARADVAGLLIDMQSRRAVALPAALAERLPPG